MKKILFLSTLASFLSCNNTKPTFLNCSETTYNYNKEAADRIIGTDIKKGSFSVEVSDTFVKIIDQNGKENVLKNDNGYSLTNKKVGDTLVIEHLPTEQTPEEILKFGTTYKFYN